MADQRNPMIIPGRIHNTGTVCPNCGEAHFTGRKVQGVITFTCLTPGCGKKWQGGLWTETNPDQFVPEQETKVKTVNGRDGQTEVIEWEDPTPDFAKFAEDDEYGEW